MIVLTCINVYLGLVFQSNNRVPDCSYTSFPMSTRIIRVQPLVLHLCIGRLLHLQTFTFAHWQTFASADLHFSTFLNTYFLWEMWPIHVIAKVWNVCYSQFCLIATWVDCVHKITNRQILKQHGFNSFFSMSLGGQKFFLLQFLELMRFENAVVRKLWKAWLFFLPDNRENTLIPLQSPVINTPF